MRYVQTAEQLEELVGHYLQQDAFVLDVETVGEHRGDPRRNRVTWIALATNGRADVIPMGHPHGELVRWEYPLKPSGLVRQEKGLPLRKSDYSVDQRKATAVWTPAPPQLTPREVWDGLEPLMFSDLTKAGHNLKFDLESVAKYYGGNVPTPPYHDTMVAAYLLKSTHRPAKAPYNRPYALASVLHRELGVEMEKGVGKEIEAHPFSVARKYTVLDGKWTWLLYKELAKQLKRDRMTKLFALEMDVLEVLCSMELTGAPMDLEALTELSPDLEELLVEIRGKAYKAAGKEFNLNANQELARILFTPKKDGGQGLRCKKLTPGGKTKKEFDPTFKPDFKDMSVDKESLKHYEGNALVDALLEYSEAERLHNNYVSVWLRDHNNGRIHADFVQNGAETGRFSCRAPNLQNVPSPKTEMGRKVRGLFIANAPEEDGNVLVVADYSQIEPRVLASFSNDPVMLKAYQDGEDIYEALAFPLGLDRGAGKVAVLAMSYGVGPETASKGLKCTTEEAKKILAGFEKKFSTVYRYKQQVVRDCKRRRPAYVETMLGRRRYLPELFSEDFGTKMRAERQAFNTLIQGSAADLIKLAMVRLHQMLEEQIPEAKILLQVHDELVTKCPADRADECVEIVREAMEGINVLKVPLLADIKVVDKWSEAK